MAFSGLDGVPASVRAQLLATKHWYLAGLLRRLAMTGYEQLARARRLAAVGVVLVVAVLAFTLGHFNNLLMTCSDFMVSGNFAPAGCSPGQGTLGG